MKGYQGRFFLGFCIFAAFVLVATANICQNFNETRLDSWGPEEKEIILCAIKGRVLRGEYVARKRVRSLLECFDECLRCHACVSINYVERTRRWCYINYNKADPTNGIKLEARINSTYYEVDRLRLREVLLGQDDEWCAEDGERCGGKTLVQPTTGPQVSGSGNHQDE